MSSGRERGRGRAEKAPVTSSTQTHVPRVWWVLEVRQTGPFEIFVKHPAKPCRSPRGRRLRQAEKRAGPRRAQRATARGAGSPPHLRTVARHRDGGRTCYIMA